MCRICGTVFMIYHVFIRDGDVCHDSFFSMSNQKKRTSPRIKAKQTDTLWIGQYQKRNGQLKK